MGISFGRRASHKNPGRKKYKEALRAGVPLYTVYYFDSRETVMWGVVSLVLTVFLAYFFYRSVWAVPALSPLGIMFYRAMREHAGKRRRRKLEVEFRDTILSVAAGLRAGYSVENAFLEAGGDIKALYGERCLMAVEFRHISGSLANNHTICEIITDLGERSGSAHIKEFADVLSIAMKSGGNIPETIRSGAEMIEAELSLKREIETTISGRKYEQNIMAAIPFVIVIYVELANPGFFDCLYGNLLGVVVMTVALVLYLIGFLWGNKMVERAVG